MSIRVGEALTTAFSVVFLCISFSLIAIYRSTMFNKYKNMPKRHVFADLL